MKTCAYIDGFNLYYSALKNTEYKWLDIVELCRRFISDSDELISVKYFTARINENPRDKEQHRRQGIYIRALQSLEIVQIIYGRFQVRDFKARRVEDGELVEVKKPEEKGSDVNLAVHLINDCWQDKYEKALVISNDSDIAEALRLVQEQKKIIGLVSPKERYCPNALKEYASFKKSIKNKHLENSQLPSTVIDINGRKITKPYAW